MKILITVRDRDAAQYVDEVVTPELQAECIAGHVDSETHWNIVDTDKVLAAAQEAQDAANLGSNDGEIGLLRDALDAALGALGLDLPEGREACEECGDKPAEEWGMCGSCLHDAKRAGWNPPSE